MAREASDYLPYTRITSNTPWSAFWDNEAIAYTLGRSATGDLQDLKVKMAITSAANIIETKRREAARDVKVQSIVTEEVRKALYPDRLDELFTKRLRKLLPSEARAISGVDWETAFGNLRTLQGQTVMAAVKTWSNSWSTSSRFHDGQIEHCILGCRHSTDSLQHYISCPRLWRAVGHSVQGLVALHVMDKLGLRDDANDHLRKLAVAFATYHGLRIEHFQMVKKANLTRSFAELAATAKEIAAVAAHATGADGR